jgi:hypothetical protein
VDVCLAAKQVSGNTMIMRMNFGAATRLPAAAVAVTAGLLVWHSARKPAPEPSGLPAIGLSVSPPTSFAASSAPPFKANITYEQVKPLLATFHDALPVELKSKPAAALETAWPDWVTRSNAEIRVRLERGDEDSIYNFWLYGTTFTTLPRITERDVAKLNGAGGAAGLLQGRLNDLLNGIAAPGDNDRLRFVRMVIERQGIDPATAEGRDQSWNFLVDLRERAIKDNDRYLRAAKSAQQLESGVRESLFATLFHDRGLSSDTRINVDFPIDQALAVLAAKGSLKPRIVRRIAIVGPGLDFADKAEGYDFYPQQSIQPYAVLDSVLRLGLVDSSELHIATLDVSPRVNEHLNAARERAKSGNPYVLQLPLDCDSPAHRWVPSFVTYWQHFGARIGDEIPPIAPPPGSNIRVRAVRVRPEMTRAIEPLDLNIVLERLAPLREEDRFDLIVATNVLLYYDAFQQSLALTNISAMLRPGGIFLTNYHVAPVGSMESTDSVTTGLDPQHNGDTLFVYRRR